MSEDSTPREPTLLDFADQCGPSGAASWTARAQNFRIDWHRAGVDPAVVEADVADEVFLILPDGPATIDGPVHAAVPAPGRSVVILPPGLWRLTLSAGASCAVLGPLRPGDDVLDAANAVAYADPDPRIASARAPRGSTVGSVRVLPIDEVRAPEGKPRLKFLQTATMSINWVEYDGQRDSAALSPHAHSDFEQGSLALAGDFVHHLRTTWGPDARLWQDDRHPLLHSPSLMVVPVHLIHTSEGVGAGRHLLIDVFSPPRADFIANGWVANSDDYAPVAAP